MIILLCIAIWLLVGFAAARVFFKVSGANHMSACHVAVLTILAPAAVIAALITWLEHFECPYPQFFKRK